jgi:hypothetical protein
LRPLIPLSAATLRFIRVSQREKFASHLGAFSFGNSIYVSVEEKFALQPSVFQCKCKRKIYAIFENRVKNGEEIASYNGGESCHAAK